MITIRKYQPADEADWVKCRVLAMLDTPYFDNVLQKKEQFYYPSIQIVADYSGKIVGLLDIEHDSPENAICYRTGSPGGIIRNLAVLPEYRNKEVATHLLKYACNLLAEQGIEHLEAWARDDARAFSWFASKGFVESYRYLHFYVSGHRCKEFGECRRLDCFVQSLYGEYTGSEPEEIAAVAERSYYCHLFEQDVAALQELIAKKEQRR